MMATAAQITPRHLNRRMENKGFVFIIVKIWVRNYSAVYMGPVKRTVALPWSVSALMTREYMLP